MIGYYKVAQPTREHMMKDVAEYIGYYNNDRLHTDNGSVSPVNHELPYDENVPLGLIRTLSCTLH